MLIAATTTAHRLRSKDNKLRNPGVYYAPPYCTPLGHYGGPPTSGGPPTGNLNKNRPLTSFLPKLHNEDEPQPWVPGRTTPHPWEDLPSTPLEDNPNRPPPQHLAPPAASLPQFSGYEGVGEVGQATIVPCPPQPSKCQLQPQDEHFEGVSVLKAEQCREALKEMVHRHACYREQCAKDHDILQLVPSNELQYSLWTYVETRYTCYQYRPYKGGPVPGPASGPPPAPWDIDCSPDHPFSQKSKRITVPHTTTIHTCHTCTGRGFTRCWRCDGLRYVLCSHCKGAGRTRRRNADAGWYDDPCGFCGADGSRSCGPCGGEGSVLCMACQGFRQLKYSIELKVTFDTHIDEHVIRAPDTPEDVVREVQPVTVFSRTSPEAWPLTSYPVQEINDTSQRMIDQHRLAFSSGRQLLQRQQLIDLPATEVHYEWKHVKSRYWVYGEQRHCYAPGYPQAVCWGCHVM